MASNSSPLKNVHHVQSSQNRILIEGGEVVNADGTQKADVYIEDRLDHNHCIYQFITVFEENPVLSFNMTMSFFIPTLKFTETHKALKLPRGEAFKNYDFFILAKPLISVFLQIDLLALVFGMKALERGTSESII